jgi:hypothetical protein
MSAILIPSKASKHVSCKKYSAELSSKKVQQKGPANEQLRLTQRVVNVGRLDHSYCVTKALDI